MTVAVLVGLFLAFADLRRALGLVGNVRWAYVVVSLGFVALSYVGIVGDYAAVFALFGIRMKGRERLHVAALSVALNNVVSFAGLSGLSLRVHVLRRRGVPMHTILAATVLHSYLNFLTLFAIYPIGLVYLYEHRILPASAARFAVVLAAVFASLLVAGAWAMARASARARLLRLVALLARRFLRRDVGARLDSFDAEFREAFAAVRRAPLRLVVAQLFFLLDWAATAAALGACFYAVGEAVRVGVLLTGLALGVTLGIVSLLPGGIGVQDASMAGTFALLGVALEPAVLATLVFRLTYYIVPFLVSIPFYRRALRAGSVA